MTSEPTMKAASINDAKTLAYNLRAKGVLVLAFGDEQFSASSYGMTRPLCDAMKQVNDRIADLIRDGVIEVPDELR